MLPKHLPQYLDRAIATLETHPSSPERDHVIDMLIEARRQALLAEHTPHLEAVMGAELRTVLTAISHHPRPEQTLPDTPLTPTTPAAPTPVAQAALALTEPTVAPPGAPPPAALSTPELHALTRDFVTDRGEIFGWHKYEMLDVGWATSLVNYIRYHDDKVPFPHWAEQDPHPSVKLPNQLDIAMAGDWGTGTEPALTIGQFMAARNPDLSIHLGDIYYAGTPEEESKKFTEHWPAGRLGSVTLNSNHEMYTGGKGYFQALQDPKFRLQGGRSYFALENDYWAIIGLDTAYFAGGVLYMDGKLDEQYQLPFLQAIGRRARASNKRIILLTHHNSMSGLGDATFTLWSQVLGALQGGPDYWYWGHVHFAVAYKPRGRIRGRCLGHGGVPYAPPLELAKQPAFVDWFESGLAGDPNIPLRALNGYMTLTLNGPELIERFYSERDELRWEHRDAGVPAGVPVAGAPDRDRLS